jgi:hypothetical protein
MFSGGTLLIVEPRGSQEHSRSNRRTESRPGMLLPVLLDLTGRSGRRCVKMRKIFQWAEHSYTGEQRDARPGLVGSCLVWGCRCCYERLVVRRWKEEEGFKSAEPFRSRRADATLKKVGSWPGMWIPIAMGD